MHNTAPERSIKNQVGKRLVKSIDYQCTECLRHLARVSFSAGGAVIVRPGCQNVKLAEILTRTNEKENHEAGRTRVGIAAALCCSYSARWHFTYLHRRINPSSSHFSNNT